jgi:putative ABC transport system permease protein
MDRLSQDLRHAIARLIRDRGFAAITILTLALGIGANTAVFSLVRTVLLQPLPYAEPDRVAVVWGPDRGEATHLSLQEVVNYGRESQSLAAMSGYQEADLNLTGGQEPERIRGGSVTPNIFEVLRVPALLGRTTSSSDVQGGVSDVIVIGHGLWQRRFGGARGVVGQVIQVNGRNRTVIGVMPASFHLPNDYMIQRPTEAWVPEVINESNLGAWGNRSYTGVARLKGDVPASTVASEFAVIADRWVKAGFVRAQPDGSLGAMARRALPVQEFVTGGVRMALFILLGAVAFVLLIACANVANLQLARADVRRREVAVRAALGAARGDIVRQLLTESVLLAIAGATAGLGVAWAGLQLVMAMRR